MHEQAVDILLVLLTGIAGFGVKFLRDMAKSVGELNRSMAVIVERLETHSERLDDHEDRIRDVERPELPLHG